MTIKAYFISALLSYACIASTYSYLYSYEVDDLYEIKFSTNRAEGTFTGLSGVVNFSDQDLENSVMDVKVEVATIKTGNKTKDKHARNSKWFHSEKYPNISYKSESITKIKDNNYQVTGLLTIKDVSEKHTINFSTNKESNNLIGVTTVNRESFNIWGNSFAFLVGEEVTVNLRIPSNYNG